ncbi:MULTISPECIES: 50S ribosomal protein L13 [unclassified Methanoculleus]|jgi:large subunit ribosomal protein L13|uniref:50S ribosomal protein L13 n=1 Tax=unclassified Methanoculleus TaxID=2619537 RepID=UPI0025FF9E90|nr:50S ribosomal protein L13 [Methanoculleus sp. UBA377]
MVTVIDADGLLLGRMASMIAQRALAGEEIAIVNVEKAIVSGSRAHVLANYTTKRERGSREGGPFFPRRPDQIVKRTIRGMLPYKRERGIAAFKRIKAYVGVPVEFSGVETETLEAAHIDRLSSPRYLTIGAISTNLGAKY